MILIFDLGPVLFAVSLIGFTCLAKHCPIWSITIIKKKFILEGEKYKSDFYI